MFLRIASASRDPSVGALLRYSSIIVIIVLDAVPGVDWTDLGTTSIELAAVPTVHTPDVEFRFRRHEGPEPRQLRSGLISRHSNLMRLNLMVNERRSVT